MREFLLEIGTEEIPAGFIPQALEALDHLMRKELETQRITFEGISTLGTPRRLVLVIPSLAERQEDIETRKIGPSRQAAFDADGNPTKAALGFAKSQSVRVDSLEIVQTEKGEYVSAVKKELGRPTAEVLASCLPRLVLSIPFQKSMRWAEVAIRFARPIHWVLALYGGEVIDFELGSIRSGNVTYGHRFMRPEAIRVDSFQTYLDRTEEAHVLVDPARRREKIRVEMDREASKVSGRALVDEALLEEVVYLVEFPVALCGSFDPSFLELPPEVVIHSMKEHQRYFPIVDETGCLLPYFICVSNIEPKDRKVVVKGNERVLRARLSDAAYFFHEDRKVPLEARVEQLKKVVFQAKLGTSYEKVMRFRQLALWICDRIAPHLREVVSRAGLLCKADLVTGMVGEFPKLQGVMGREYARLSGESAEVSDAIRDHYLPAFAGDRLPDSPVGDFVGMADRLDTIVGCFGVGLLPTGTADPFGLRRQALAIIRIILEKRYPLSLVQMIEESARLLKEKLERPATEVQKEVLDFFKVRYENFLLDQGYPFDVAEAALSISFDELLDVQHRVDALREARRWEDFESVLIAFKRAMNILKGITLEKGIDPSSLSEAPEKQLYEAFLRAKGNIERSLANRDYESALQETIKMKRPIDAFFEGVMVMVDDEKIRDNRLALLDAIGKLFLKIADFSRLS